MGVRATALGIALGMAWAGAAMAAAPPIEHPPLHRTGHRPPRAVHGMTRGGSAAARLDALFDDDADREAALDPLSAMQAGDDTAAHALDALYTDGLDARRLASARASLAELARIARGGLDPARRVSYDAFAFEKREEAMFLAPPFGAMVADRPFNHFEGLHTGFPAMMAPGGGIAYASAADYRRALAIDMAFAGVLDRAIVRFRRGMAAGTVEPRLTVEDMIGQIDAMLALGVDGSPYAAPVQAFPATVPDAERPALLAEYRAAIAGTINPAYARLRDFLAREYLPVARDNVGLWAMPGGPALYRALIERETTLPLDPAAIHRIGLTEVARIQREMSGVAREMGYDGPLRGFFDRIRSDPQYHPRTAADLADGYAAIGRAVDAQIPRFFATVPKEKLVIAPYPAYRGRYEAGASYDDGAPDGTRPGTFWFNTYDLPSRFLTGMTTLYLHEGVPGHHFQISLAQENAALPDFQRFGGNNAFVEGWALYAETLGYPMGLYRNPAQHWGTLDDEMLRAMRLVVDTGLHADRWSREQAVAYMLANSGMGRSDAEAEVDRYIADPAQALSYKIGALTIQRLRAEAEAALGARFDIRAFHGVVLGSGALPLPVLEAKVREWILAEKAKG